MSIFLIFFAILVSLGGGRVSDEEVVRLDVCVDHPHAVEQLYQPQELGGEVQGQRLHYGFVCVLGDVDEVEEGAHPLVLGHQHVAVPVGEASGRGHEARPPVHQPVLQGVSELVIPKQ